ncbi:MAG: sugar phosphate nucleotidyltransferase [Anaerolineales bacterium]|jgi:mannose-1-phosphate guanylyltransferase
MLENYYAVIMAGGGGTRLWPLSRQTRPKQMLALVDERTLFQTAVDRLVGLFPPERILVVTVQEQAEQLQAQCPEIPEENFLLETQPRGTAAVVGLAALALKLRDPQAVMTVLTADHVIKNEILFRDILRAAYEVSLEDYLITIGITPNYPATGYGYIKQGEILGTYQDLGVYHALHFVEKPDQKTAISMMNSGLYTWNSGMFIWRVERIVEELARQMPDLYNKLLQIEKSWVDSQISEVQSKIWSTIAPQTIDYGVMENADEVVIIPTKDLGWFDVGSWDAMYDLLPTDENGNLIINGKEVIFDTHDSLFYLSDDDKLIVSIAVENLILVDTDDVLLICRKDQAQKVRQVVDRLKKINTKYV